MSRVHPLPPADPALGTFLVRSWVSVEQIWPTLLLALTLVGHARARLRRSGEPAPRRFP